MDKDIAREIIDLLKSIDKPANRVLELLNALDDDEEAKPLRKAMRNVGIDVYSELMVPIFKQYPELDREAD